MSQTKDLTGQQFGNLKVLRRSEKKKGTSWLWECECQCKDKNITYATSSDLKSGKRVSCGCLRKRKLAEEGRKKSCHFIGEKLGSWKLIQDTGIRKDGKIIWDCECLLCYRHRNISTEKLRQLDKLPICVCQNERSLGEKKIIELLEKHHIPFIREYKYPDLKYNGKHLRFDFYVDNNYLIEYDGRQHFKQGSWEPLESIQYRDNLKNQYCKDNNIKLIRIPYTHYEQLSIEDLLLSSEFLMGG